MKKLCIFDLDGTLSNTLESIAFYVNSALADCGYPTVERLDDFRYLVGSGVPTLIRRSLGNVAGAYTHTESERVQKVYDAAYATDPMYLVQEYEGIRDLLSRLVQKGVPLAVLSNKPDDMTKQVVARLFGEIPFARCYGQREGVEKKPSPQGAQIIAQELGISPRACVYIGDTAVDMRAAKGAGMTAVGVLWGFRTEKELRDGGADGIVSHPCEILAWF